jgi:hypothetical protein
MSEHSEDIEAESEPYQADATEAYPSGEALTSVEALAVTRAAPTRVIVVAGPHESGKTTLVASLYERFHSGPFAGYFFAGSRTLVGFERRCHLSRRASGRETPDTERTSQAASDVLLHLTVRAEPGGSRSDLLFTDIYGEAFRQAADSTDEAEQLSVLRRADHVALLLDGAKLASLTQRQEPFSQADALLASCLEVGVLGPESQVQVLVTKSDRLRSGPRSEANVAFVAARWAWLEGRYRDRFASLEQFEVAARPEAPSLLGTAHGLDNIFPLWVSRPRPASPHQIESSLRGHGPFDWFARAWAARRG